MKAWTWVVGLAGVVAMVAAVRAEVPVPPGLKPDMAAKIKAALPGPGDLQAKPAAPRKLLVLSLTTGFRHSSIPAGIYAISAMGEKTGAYTATCTEKLDLFEPEKLKEFDAVLMLNTTGDLFFPRNYRDLKGDERKAADEKADRLKQAFSAYVQGGKGLAGIHAATDTFPHWPEYLQTIGGCFDGHPWGAGSKVWVRIEDPDHPLCACFEHKPNFEVQDEIYQMREYYRERQRVLTGLDPTKMDLTLSPTNPTKGLKRKDNDYPITWVRMAGQGRVFYCSLGHNEHIYWNTMILKHYLAGLQFALGDLKATTESLPKK